MPRTHRKPAKERSNADRTTARELAQQWQRTREELEVAEKELRQQNEELNANRENLEAQQQLFHELFEFAPDGYLVTDLKGVIQRANQTAADLLKLSEERLVGKPLMVFLNQAVHEAFYEGLQHLSNGRRLSAWEAQLQPRGGESIPVLINAVAYSRSGEATHLYWLLRDFTALHQARHALQASEARYRAIVEDQTELVCRFRPDGTLSFVNDAFCRFFERSADQLIGHSLFSLLPRQERPRVRERLARLTPAQPAVTFEHRIRHADGNIGWQQWTDRAIFDDSGRCREIQAVGSCITELKRREQELQRSREQLRNLTAHQQSVREEERATIAREIHDALGQELTALKIGLVRLQSTMPSQGIITELLEGVDRMLETVQHIAAELRPALLDDLGLTAAIEWQTGKFRERTGIDCRLDLGGDDIVDDAEQRIALFRIVQEALTNVARHAAATRVRVTLRRYRDSLRLRIEDDGKGLTAEQIDDPRSLGLLGMRERALSVGGELHIVRRQGGGTGIEVRLPLASTANPGAVDYG